MRGAGTRGKLQSRFFRTTGGKVNVTALIRTGALAGGELRPGNTIRFEGRTAYRRSDSRPSRTIRLIGRSASAPASIDVVKARVFGK